MIKEDELFKDLDLDYLGLFFMDLVILLLNSLFIIFLAIIPIITFIFLGFGLYLLCSLISLPLGMMFFRFFIDSLSEIEENFYLIFKNKKSPKIKKKKQKEDCLKKIQNLNKRLEKFKVFKFFYVLF